jgi:hypothetical protein
VRTDRFFDKFFKVRGNVSNVTRFFFDIIWITETLLQLRSPPFLPALLSWDIWAVFIRRSAPQIMPMPDFRFGSIYKNRFHPKKQNNTCIF